MMSVEPSVELDLAHWTSQIKEGGVSFVKQMKKGIINDLLRQLNVPKRSKMGTKEKEEALLTSSRNYIPVKSSL